MVPRTRGTKEAAPWFNPNLPIYQVVTTEYPAPTYLLTDENQRLDSAGYLDRNGDGIREKPDGSPLSLVAGGVPLAGRPGVFTIQGTAPGGFTPFGPPGGPQSRPGAPLPGRGAPRQLRRV